MTEKEYEIQKALGTVTWEVYIEYKGLPDTVEGVFNLVENEDNPITVRVGGLFLLTLLNRYTEDMIKRGRYGHAWTKLFAEHGGYPGKEPMTSVGLQVRGYGFNGFTWRPPEEWYKHIADQLDD